MKLSKSSLVHVLLVLSSLAGLSLARLGADDAPEELQDASISHPDRDLQNGSRLENNGNGNIFGQGSRPFSNPNIDELLNNDDRFVRVMVGFKNDSGRNSARGVAQQRWREMRNLSVATMVIAKTSVELLRSNINIDYVEMDGLIMPDAEGTPIGIGLSQGGNSDIIPATPPSSSSSSSSSGACNDPNSFKVAIVDSGLQADHPDVPCRDVNDVDTNCMGASFGIGDLPWYAPQNQAWHGTHVFGTIGATGNNGIGITSMVPNSDDNNICYMIVRVFGDDGGGQYASVLFEGINWAIGEGANVINMSLSGSQTYVTGQSTFNVAQARGILSVAAAGNGNSDSLRYPASYNHVISVAAVDNYGNRAGFSQYNGKVDIAAPGVSVNSTVLSGGYARVTGTSMSAPHVTGAIARVWSVCRQCSPVEVEQCLLQTASGTSRTDELGYGLVRAEDAYECLVNTGAKCCAEEEVEEVVVVEEEEIAETPNPPLQVAITFEDEPEELTAQCNSRLQVGQFCRNNRQCCSQSCSRARGGKCIA